MFTICTLYTFRMRLCGYWSTIVLFENRSSLFRVPIGSLHPHCWIISRLYSIFLIYIGSCCSIPFRPVSLENILLPQHVCVNRGLDLPIRQPYPCSHCVITSPVVFVSAYRKVLSNQTIFLSTPPPAATTGSAFRISLINVRSCHSLFACSLFQPCSPEV